LITDISAEQAVVTSGFNTFETERATLINGLEPEIRMQTNANSNDVGSDASDSDIDYTTVLTTMVNPDESMRTYSNVLQNYRFSMIDGPSAWIACSYCWDDGEY
jgi:hypothetical protein